MALRNFLIDDQERLLYAASMRLKQIIRDSGLRQNWVADQVGLHPVRFNMILSDKSALPSEYIAPLAKILRLSGDEILNAIRVETPP